MESRKKAGKRSIAEWPKSKTMEYFKKSAIIRALKFFGGNSTRAATALHVSVKTVRNYKRKYKLYGIANYDPAWEAQVKALKNLSKECN